MSVEMMLHSDVLIFWAQYGDGHRQASRALEKALLSICPHLAISSIDYMEFVNPLLSRVTRVSYYEAVKVAPFLYGYFYRATGNIATDSFFQQQLNRLGYHKTLQLMEQMKGKLKVVISTYPTATGVLGELRREGLMEIPLVTIITDHAVHSQWITPGTDLYLVASDRVRAGLIKRGVPGERVIVTGIPIDSKFNQNLNRDELYLKYGLDPQLPVVLVMGGGYGLGGVPEVCRTLARFPRPIQVVVLTGKDWRTRARVEGIAAHAEHPMMVYGYVEEIHELMTVADILITKAGGLTTSEALARELPMIIFRPIPGQEEENTRYLLKTGAAMWARSTRELASRLERFLTDEQLRQAMRQKAAKVKKPDAAQMAAWIIYEQYLAPGEEAGKEGEKVEAEN